tara:strand:+ start:65 stop:310 length:246 start_codon:yes stop_codon:yes gene_type:complete
MNKNCVSCKANGEETFAECTVSKKASELWDLNINDTYCWDCWDNIHWEYQDLARNGDCYCDLCEHNRNKMIRKVSYEKVYS